MLISLLGMLAILSLEKVPLAVFFSLAIYLLAKLSGLISQMLAESVYLSDGSAASRATEFIFNSILYFIPDSSSLAQNDVFFDAANLLAVLGTQFQSVVVYALFLLAVSLIDFYRKEFSF
jgi:hypothetical protein